MLPLVVYSSLVNLEFNLNLLRRKKMIENADRINGCAAMLGVIAALGSYALTGQIIPGVW